MVFPIFFPVVQRVEVKTTPLGGKFSHLGVSAMLGDEKEILETMKHFGASAEQIEFQKGKIAGLQLAQNLTEQNTDW